jgi:hypothetical protein
MHAMVRHALVMLLLAAGMPAVEWTGKVVVREVLELPEPAGADRDELAAYRRDLNDRITRHRAILPGAPTALARLLREDIAFFNAELERSGGRSELPQTSFLISGQRLRIDGAFGQLLIDRSTGTAVLAGGGGGETEAESVALRPMPAAVEPWGDLVEQPAGAPVQPLSVTLRADGRMVTVVYLPRLPNPWALGLTANSGEDSIQVALASVPGLPWSYRQDLGRGSRWMQVRLYPGEVPDSSFHLDRR